MLKASLSGNGEHAVYAGAGIPDDPVLQMDFRLFVEHTGVEFLQGVALHVGTLITGAGILRWCWYEGFVWRSFYHLVDNPRLCGYDKDV